MIVPDPPFRKLIIHNHLQSRTNGPDTPNASGIEKARPRNEHLGRARVGRKQLTADVVRCLNTGSTHPSPVTQRWPASDASRGETRPRSAQDRHRGATTIRVRALPASGVRRPRAPDGAHSAEVRAIHFTRRFGVEFLRADCPALAGLQTYCSFPSPTFF